jgi:hypothetical protein
MCMKVDPAVYTFRTFPKKKEYFWVPFFYGIYTISHWIVSCSKEMVDIIIHTEYGAESSVKATVDCGVCERTRNVTRNSYS